MLVEPLAVAVDIEGILIAQLPISITAPLSALSLATSSRTETRKSAPAFARYADRPACTNAIASPLRFTSTSPFTTEAESARRLIRSLRLVEMMASLTTAPSFYIHILALHQVGGQFATDETDQVAHCHFAFVEAFVLNRFPTHVLDRDGQLICPGIVAYASFHLQPSCWLSTAT
ncbi:MAG: hypothetical protein HONDAALG_02101 [Gammaproteobacteria bacterium]|nr:hypothetical protein [Gammaproteobacteria bacterium]